MGWTPAGDGTEEQGEVILVSQLLGRGHVTAQPHEDLETHRQTYGLKLQAGTDRELPVGLIP